MAVVTDPRDATDSIEQRVHRVVLRRRGQSTHRHWRRQILRSTLDNAAAIATLRAELQELAANLHEVAASIHDLQRDEHVKAFLHGFGDPILLKEGAERHRAAAAAERTSAETVRQAVRQGPQVEVIRYTDKLGYDRKIYRLQRQGVFVGEYKTPGDLGMVIDLSTVVEYEPGQQSALPPE